MKCFEVNFRCLHLSIFKTLSTRNIFQSNVQSKHSIWLFLIIQTSFERHFHQLKYKERISNVFLLQSLKWENILLMVKRSIEFIDINRTLQLVKNSYFIWVYKIIWIVRAFSLVYKSVFALREAWIWEFIFLWFVNLFLEIREICIYWHVICGFIKARKLRGCRWRTEN